MVDTNHQSFPRSVGKSQKSKSKVKMNQSIDNTDFRLMECQDENDKQSYFVVYPAPESRKLDLFGFCGRKNVLSVNFISDNLILAQLQSKNIYHTW